MDKLPLELQSARRVEDLPQNTDVQIQIVARGTRTRVARVDAKRSFVEGVQIANFIERKLLDAESTWVPLKRAQVTLPDVTSTNSDSHFTED